MYYRTRIRAAEACWLERPIRHVYPSSLIYLTPRMPRNTHPIRGIKVVFPVPKQICNVLPLRVVPRQDIRDNQAERYITRSQWTILHRVRRDLDALFDHKIQIAIPTLLKQYTFIIEKVIQRKCLMQQNRITILKPHMQFPRLHR